MKRNYKVNDLILQFKRKDKIALARLISLIENEPERASEIFKHFENNKNDSYIIGITGSPGVGKSTLVGSIVKKLLKENKTIGVISVDPTSPFSGGAFLGDRVRMTEISLHPNLFMRSLASRGSKGGLSRAVFDIIMLYEAFGMDLILIETVGAGQSEFEIYNLAHTVVVVLVPGYGDAIQMQKAGIIEIGDVYDVNKKDLGGEDIAVQIEMMLDDSTLQGGWRPPVSMTNSISGEGVDKLIQQIFDHKEHLELSGILEKKKEQQLSYKIRELLFYKIDKVLESLISQKEIHEIHAKVIDNKFQVYEAIHDLFSNVKFERKR
ncbi:MAG: methylmalonyl Co-A mutase-associated GTPase MeaB [Promethearchaeota archaeon]